MPNIYTRTGDQGATGLFGGTRVPKQAARVEAYGTVDEANAAIGAAKLALTPDYRGILHHIQDRLFTLAAELASDERGAAILAGRIAQTDVEDLEHIIDGCLDLTGPATHFVIPGADPASAGLHQARTITRRAERAVLRLGETEPVRGEIIRYLNRLSDTLYAIARVFQDRATLEDIERIVRRAVAKAAGKGPAMPDQESVFNLATAKALAVAAEAKAAELGVPIVFAAVDAGGNLILVHRMDDSLLVSIDVAINKAFTSAAIRLPTAALHDDVTPPGPLYGIDKSNGGRIIVFGGGLPVSAGGRHQGGIGVSGGTAEEDVIIVTYARDHVLGS